MKIYLYLLFLVLLFSSCEYDYANHFYDDQKVKLGDNPAWSKIDFDDSAWKENIEVAGKGVFWLRINFELYEDEVKELQVDQGIQIGGTGSYELWLDEKYLGKNGELQTADRDEMPGTYHAFFDIPDSLLTTGKHVAAFRMTQQSDKVSQHLYFIIDNYFEITRKPLQTSQYMFLFTGAFLLAAVYFLFMFFSHPKEISPLIFSIICVLFCGLLTMEYLKFFYLYEYPFQNTRMEIIGYLHISLAVLVPLFFMLQFSIPHKKILILLLIGVIYCYDYYCHSSYDWVAMAHNRTMLLFSCLLTGYAIYQAKKGAKVAFAGVLFGYLFVHILPRFESFRSIIAIFDISQFIAFVVIVLCMFYILTLRIREERLAYEASLVLSERLKNELLKKNIKPHFIMNTLTSLIDWVEESPKEGVKFITALAGEFETLNEVADYKLVPIGQEIKLCKNHLKVMSYRKEITYKWEEENIDANEIIPPAIIHTAVENGVTHSLPNANGVITFRLIYEKNEKAKKYILQTIAQNRKENAVENTGKKGGTGLKYIKARLQESYRDKWAVSSQATDEGWETIFEIFE